MSRRVRSRRSSRAGLRRDSGFGSRAGLRPNAKHAGAACLHPALDWRLWLRVVILSAASIQIPPQIPRPFALCGGRVSLLVCDLAGVHKWAGMQRPFQMHAIVAAPRSLRRRIPGCQFRALRFLSLCAIRQPQAKCRAARATQGSDACVGIRPSSVLRHNLATRGGLRREGALRLSASRSHVHSPAQRRHREGKLERRGLWRARGLCIKPACRTVRGRQCMRSLDGWRSPLCISGRPEHAPLSPLAPERIA